MANKYSDAVILSVDEICAEIDACRRLLIVIENSKKIDERLARLVTRLTSRDALVRNNKTNSLTFEMLAMQCEKLDIVIARNLWLAYADYSYHIVKKPSEAAYALERCSSLLDHNVRKKVLILEWATRLYEEANKFDDAVRVELALEMFDLSVDWVRNSRRRQEALLEKR